METLKILYVTTTTPEEAQKIAYQCITKSLAACANIFSPIQSTYYWEDKLIHGTEIVILLKTRSGSVNKLISYIKDIHLDECPCIIALDTAECNNDFLNWIKKATCTQIQNQ